MDDRRPPVGWSPPVLRAIASRLLIASRAISPGQLVIAGIDGPSGAGKTTLARQLTAHLSAAGGDEPGVVPLDRIYPGWDGLEAGVTILAEQVLAPLRQGVPASYQRWDWLHDRPMSRRGAVERRWCVIAEGVGSCARRCASHLDVRVWVDAPPATRYERAMARDGATYRPHWDRWAAQERQHFGIERTSERADVRVDQADARSDVINPGNAQVARLR